MQISLPAWAAGRNLSEPAGHAAGGHAARRVIWEPLPWSGTQEEESPDFADLIEQLTSLPSWRADGSCVVVLKISHASGDGTRSFTATDTSAEVSYVLPSPLAQLDAVDGPQNCSFSLAVDSATVSPRSETYLAVQTPAASDGGRRVRRLELTPRMGVQPAPASSTCAASNARMVDNLLSGRNLTAPLPLAVEIEATPSRCLEDTAPAPPASPAPYPTCSVQPAGAKYCYVSSTAAPSTPWNTCRVRVNGYDAVVGNPVEPTHPSGGICAASITPDTLQVSGSGCWKTHLSGFQVELFGRFVEAVPLGHLIALVSCGTPWFKSENFDIYFLKSRVDELWGVLSTIGFASRSQMDNTGGRPPRLHASTPCRIKPAAPPSLKHQ